MIIAQGYPLAVRRREPGVTAQDDVPVIAWQLESGGGAHAAILANGRRIPTSLLRATNHGHRDTWELVMPK